MNKKNNKNTLFISILLFVLVHAGSAHAYGSLRCKGQFIDVGDNVADVLSLCGEPSERIVTQVPVRVGNALGFTRAAGYTAAEQLIYDRGWGKFPAVLYIDDGKVQRIEYLSR
jgi:hypothetical protein